MLKRVAKVFGISQLLIAVAIIALEIFNIPDSLEVKMDTPALVGVQVGYQNDDGKIVYDRERPYSSFGEAGTIRVVLSTSHGLSDMAWGFKNGPCEITLNSVVVKKWLVIPLEIPFVELTTFYQPTDGMSVALAEDGSAIIKLQCDGGYFVPDKTKPLPFRICITGGFLAQIASLELLLLLISLIVLLLKIQDDKVTFKHFIWQAVAVSLLASFFFCIALPLQSYMVNRESWPFTCGELLAECIVAFFVSGVSLVAIFSALRPCFARLPMAFVWGLVLCCYLETGILSLGLPALNGDIAFFALNPSRAHADLVALCSVMALVILTYRWIRCYLHYMAIGLAVMVLASLFDVRVEEEINDCNAIVQNFCSSEDVVGSAFYSKEDNKLIFILDTVTTEVVMDILNEDIRMANVFSGFIAYTNNIGMQQMTVVGIPGIMHGKYLDVSSKMRTYESSALSDESFMKPYIDLHIPTFFMLSLTRPYNWSSEVEKTGVSTNADGSSTADVRPMKRRLSGLQAWNMMEVLRFRLTPFKFKFNVFLMTIKDWPLYEKGATEFSLFPKLAELPVREGVDQTLHVYHTAGAHAPFFTDRFGNKLPSPGLGYSGYREKAYFVINSLAKLLKDLQTRGLYDNCFIVVTSDHGGDYTQREDVVCNGVDFPRAIPYPLLMVKPRGGEGHLVFSDIPTSHSKLSSLMSSARTKQLTAQDVTDILHEDNRLFRYFISHESVHYDWKFGPDGSVTCEKIEE